MGQCFYRRWSFSLAVSCRFSLLVCCSEAGQSKTDIGQIVLAARFINDIGTVFSLALITAQLNFRLAFFAAAMLAAAWSIPKIAPFIMRNEPKGSEAGTRFLVFVLFLLGGLGSVSGTEAVVPAYLIGVVLAPLLQKEEAMAGRLKSAAFAWFTPFYFLRTGSLLGSYPVACDCRHDWIAACDKDSEQVRSSCPVGAHVQHRGAGRLVDRHVDVNWAYLWNRRGFPWPCPQYYRCATICDPRNSSYREWHDTRTGGATVVEA